MMMIGCAIGTPTTWALAACLVMSIAGCTDGPAGSAADNVVAVVDGTPITERELDEAVRPQLQRLEHARYELRLQELQRMIARRVLGNERAERDGDESFRAATAEADIQIRLLPPADDPPRGDASANGSDPIGGDGTAPRRSALSVTLVGTIVREDAAKSMAAIRVPGALLARNVQPGQPIVEGATLLRVERNRILLRNNGVLEFLPLSVSNEPSTPIPPRTLARFARTPDTVLSLRRSDVDRALRDIGALERSLTHAAPEFDGRRRLVLGPVDAGTLYELLQLQERDVLLQVNGEWVDDGRNPLWDALRTGSAVSLLVMRAGEPHAFAYEIN